MKKFKANRKKTFYLTIKQIHAQDNHILSSLKRDIILFEEEYAIRPSFALQQGSRTAEEK